MVCSSAATHSLPPAVLVVVITSRSTARRSPDGPNVCAAMARPNARAAAPASRSRCRRCGWRRRARSWCGALAGSTAGLPVRSTSNSGFPRATSSSRRGSRACRGRCCRRRSGHGCSPRRASGASSRWRARAGRLSPHGATARGTVCGCRWSCIASRRCRCVNARHRHFGTQRRWCSGGGLLTPGLAAGSIRGCRPRKRSSAGSALHS